MADIRSPGIYYEKIEERIPDLALGPTGQAAFLGMTTRGPLHHPVKISSYGEFLETYGPPLKGGYLADSIKGYFTNGGKICYIVRVAHTFQRGRTRVATVASSTLHNPEGKPCIRIDAHNEGTWGNEIRIKTSVPAEPRDQTLLVRDVAPGESRMSVRSSRGFQVGTVCKLSDGQKTRYVTLSRVDGKELGWLTPLDAGFKSSAPTFIEPVVFDIEAEIPGYKETFTNLSAAPGSGRYFERYINTESQLLRVTNLTPELAHHENIPTTGQRLQLDGGYDGLQDLTPQDFIGFNNGPRERYGLGALEIVEDVDLICIPDLFAAREFSADSGFRSYRDVEAVQEAALNHCERLKDRFALLDIPPRSSFEQTQQWRRRFDSSFGAVYFPWLVIPTEGRRKRSVPPSAFIAGVVARTDARYNVHKAPANEVIEGAVDLDVLLSEKHIGLLNSEGVNCIKFLGTRGIRIWGARTLSSDPDWRYINTRRIFNALRQALELGTQWAVFENNNLTLWKSVERNLTTFMEDLWKQGFFKGMSPEQGFYVVCDHTTNPVEQINAGMMVCEIGIAPVKPAEFITFQVKQHIEDRSVEDATQEAPL